MVDEKTDTEDEEIAIDFSGIKRLFKKDKKADTTKNTQAKKEESSEKSLPEEDDEVSIDFSRKRHLIVPLLLLLVVIIINTNIRMYNRNLPITDVWAAQSVYNYNINLIKSNIEQKYP